MDVFLDYYPVVLCCAVLWLWLCIIADGGRYEDVVEEQ